MTRRLFALAAAEGLAESLCRDFGLAPGALSRRQFPDGETYLRLMTPVDRQDVILLCTLDRPDAKLLPLLFAAAAARAQGARSVGLVAPYLSYMRQDRAFHPGEAITSATFARLLSDGLDWLITLDPHLHRYPSLETIYSVPSFVASAAAPIAAWIRREVDNPVIIGPDEESRQWVARIAKLAGARSTVFKKTRRGDFDVSITADEAVAREGATPVIVDDIASSARTMIEAVQLLRGAGMPPPVCIAVHPIFAGDAYEKLLEAGPTRVVSTNAVPHPSNAIDISGEIGALIDRAIEAAPREARMPRDKSPPTAEGQ